MKIVEYKFDGGLDPVTIAKLGVQGLASQSFPDVVERLRQNPAQAMDTVARDILKRVVLQKATTRRVLTPEANGDPKHYDMTPQEIQDGRWRYVLTVGERQATLMRILNTHREMSEWDQTRRDRGDMLEEAIQFPPTEATTIPTMAAMSVALAFTKFNRVYSIIRIEDDDPQPATSPALQELVSVEI